MVDTPWGPSESLRDRMLRPGPGTPAADVARNQRRRLFGAMVASVSERGYPATRLSDLTDLSGVSRNSFYNLFVDKDDCFVTATEAILEQALSTLTMPAGTWEQQVHTVATAFAALFVAQPAAARMCLIDAHAVGPDGLRPFEEATEKFEGHARRVVDESPEHAGAPPELISALVGGLIEVARSRLRLNSEAEMPAVMEDLVRLVLSYRPPPEPLRLNTRPPTPAPETIDAYDRGERALRALAAVAAERGYANTTVTQIVKSASMSPTTFYANFRDKEDALMAAIDSAGAQLVAAILPAFRRNRDWPQAVRAAFGAFFNFLASRPALAQLVMVEVYAAGPDAIGRREEALRPLEILLAEGHARAPEVPAVTSEAIRGGIYALAYKQIRKAGPESLSSLAPICTYVTLAPFIGPQEACAAANGDGRGRGTRDAELPHDLLLSKVLVVLSTHEANAAEIAPAVKASVTEVRQSIAELQQAELVTATEEQKDPSQERRYRSELRWVEETEWDRMSLPDRQRISRLIARLVTGELDLALETGTLDARIDRHMSRVPILVDEHGWQRLMDIHREAFLASLAVEAESAERLKQADEPPIEGRSVQILFEVPRSDLEPNGRQEEGAS